MKEAQQALNYANEVFAEMLKSFKRKKRNQIVFSALYTLHQQAVNTYHVLATRSHRDKMQA